jgi:hypothetical protein
MSSYEYNQLLKFLYFEGYADSYEEAEYILEDMSDEEFEELLENSGMSAANRKTWERLVRTKGDRPFTAPRTQGTKSARRREPDPTPPPATIEDPEEKAKQERRKKRGPLKFKVAENFEEVVEYLFVEGYTDTIESAELMAESISAEWITEILGNHWGTKISKDPKTNKWKATTLDAYNTPHPAAVQNAASRNDYERRNEIEAKWAKKDKKENK